VEVANFARRFFPEAKKYYQRKLAKVNRIVATKSFAGKISKSFGHSTELKIFWGIMPGDFQASRQGA